MARRKARILAFQALYSWDMGNTSVQDLLSFPWVEKESLENSNPENLVFAKLLISGTIEHIDEIDELLKNHLDSWDFDRINKIDLAVLRISVYPLLYQQDIHPTIIINEAIDISKNLGRMILLNL